MTALKSLKRVVARSQVSYLIVSASRRENRAVFDLQVTPHGRVPLGRFDTEILVVPVTEEGAELPSITVRAQGVVVPDVEASPVAVLFGSRTVGEQHGEAVSLQSLTGQSIHLKQRKVSGDGLTATTIGAAKGNRIELEVRQEVSRQGALEGKVELQIERQDGKMQSLTIPVSCIGL